MWRGQRSPCLRREAGPEMEQNTTINQGIMAPELISTPAKGALLCVCLCEPLDLCRSAIYIYGCFSRPKQKIRA